MSTLLIAAALLAIVGLALGRAPLYRVLACVVAMPVTVLLAVAWAALFAAADLEHWLPAHGRNVDGAGIAATLLLPPLLATPFVLRRLRRRGWPRFLWRLAERPATLSLPGILAVQAAVLLTCVVGGNAVAAFRERQAERAWSAAGQPLGALARRYPKTPTNAAGLELARLAAGLGIEAGSRSDPRDLRGQGAHASVVGPLFAYVRRETTRAEGLPDAPPLEVRAWLAVTADPRRAIEAHLVGGGPIVWDTDIDAWRPYRPLGVSELHAALLAAALDAQHGGRTAEAWRSVDAASRLTASLRERPHTSARLQALVQDRGLLGALRAFGRAGEKWGPRLDALAGPTGLLDGLGVEVRSVLDDARGSRTTARGFFLETNWALDLLERPRDRKGAAFAQLSGGPVGLEDAGAAVETERARARGRLHHLVVGPLERPYLRLSAADYARASADARSEALRDGGCSSAPDPKAPRHEARLALWNLMGEGSVSAARLARSAAILRVEAELTRHVLRARALREADPGRAWPRDLADMDSSACPGWRWLYEVSPDDSARVRLEANPFGGREALLGFRMSGR